MTRQVSYRTPGPALLITGLLALVLAACQPVKKRHPPRLPDHYPPEGPPVDAPPDNADFDVHQVAEWVVRPEPISEYGNHSPYEVLGQRYEVKQPKLHFTQTGTASWYGKKFHGRLTSNREIFDMYRFTAAHRSLPLPSYVRVTNLKNGRSLVVRVNDRGPFKPDRIIDLSWAAAKKLGYVDDGIAPVRIELVQAPFDPNKHDTPQKGLLFLQVGAFSVEQKAKKIAQDIGLKTGLPVHTSKTNESGTPLYRVRVGPLVNPRHVDQAKHRLKEMGHQKPRLVVE